LGQTKTVDVQKSAINQTENQNPGERGVQDLSSMGVSSNKGPEVGHSAKVEVAQQVEQKIIQNFEPAKPMTLQMTLSPDNLGDIDIKLSYNQGKLIIDIMAASSETQKLLGNQINQLVRGLALQNVQVETVHLNTPVEATENGESMGSLLNDGSQFSQQQNNAPLKEQFLSKGTIQNNPFSNGAQDSNDELISLAQNLQYNGQRRINYLV
jgi:flagellar hook-length control protein FliK